MSWKDLKDRVLGTGEENEPEFGMTMEMPLRELVASQLATLSVRARSDGLDELPLAVRIQLSVDLCMLTLASGLLSGEISVAGNEEDGAGVVLEEISHDSVTLLIQGKAISDRYDRDKVTVKYDLDDHPAIAAAGHLMVPTRVRTIVQLQSISHHLRYGLPIDYGDSPISPPMLLWMAWDETVSPTLSTEVAKRMSSLCMEALGQEPDQGDEIDESEDCGEE